MKACKFVLATPAMADSYVTPHKSWNKPSSELPHHPPPPAPTPNWSTNALHFLLWTQQPVRFSPFFFREFGRWSSLLPSGPRPLLHPARSKHFWPNSKHVTTEHSRATSWQGYLASPPAGPRVPERQHSLPKVLCHNDAEIILLSTCWKTHHSPVVDKPLLIVC